MPMHMISVPTSVKKADIKSLRALKGMKNGGTMYVAGKSYASQKLVFVGLVASLNTSTGMYDGCLEFREAVSGSDANLPSADLGLMPGLPVNPGLADKGLAASPKPQPIMEGEK